MMADNQILQLPYVDLNQRELLPESPGIYYVLDDNKVVWYIGQATNLKTRWSGKSHHRLYQLQKQRKQHFIIYYEPTAESQLDAIEKLRIECYNPQLNGTKVKVKKLHPAERLLRETLFMLAPYSFILGVEPPRKDDSKLISSSTKWRQEWRVQKAVLPLQVIHICVNFQELLESDDISSERNAKILLTKAFKKRSNFSNNWEVKPASSAKTYSSYTSIPLRRLLVNGLAIEAYGVFPEVIQHIQGYEMTQLAGVSIRAVNESSLAAIKDKCLLNVIGLYLPSQSQNDSFRELCQASIKRLSPYSYKEDIVKLVFHEELDTSKLKIQFPTEVITTQESESHLPIRLANLAAKKEHFKSLLINRGLDLNRYQVNKYLDKIPENENHFESSYDQRMTVFLKSFMYPDLKTGYYSRVIYSDRSLNSSEKEVFLAATVDRVFWLLLEPYLSDFTKVTLNQNQGYVGRQYVSARKFLVPALLKVTINGKWKADVPFGSQDSLSYIEVVEIIKKRLAESGIPKLRFSFQYESTRS
jgi:hypothetical protein